jgi:hypothetical protein
MVILDASVHSEHAKVIRCDFKLGSVERSIDLERGHTSAAAGNTFSIRHQWKLRNFAVAVKIHIPPAI